MLIIGYVFGIRSERALLRKGKEHGADVTRYLLLDPKATLRQEHGRTIPLMDHCLRIKINSDGVEPQKDLCRFV